MKIESAIKSNCSMKFLRKYYSSDELNEKLEELAKNNIIELVRRIDNMNYRVISTDFEENNLFKKLLISSKIHESQVNELEIKYFIENSIGKIIKEGEYWIGSHLTKPNPLQNKLKQGRLITNKDILKDLQNRGKIELSTVSTIVDYTHKNDGLEQQAKINLKYIPVRLAYNDFIDQIAKYFINQGFNRLVADQVLETTWAFDNLLCTQFHPVRSEVDTFYIDSPLDVQVLNQNSIMKYCLRPHTTGSEFKRLNQLKIERGKFFEISKVFRNERADSTHLIEFNQLEIGIFQDNLTLGHLHKVIEDFMKELKIKQKVKIRPSYYPYTSPSADVYLENGGKELEIAGGGLFIPSIFKSCTSIKRNSGIGVGIGIERLFLIANPQYNIKDIAKIFEITNA